MQSPMWAPGLHRSHPLANGLVGLWPMWDGDGDKVMDLAGGNTGTLTNMDPATDWVATEKGWALDYAGDDDYVTTGKTAVSGQTLMCEAGNAFTVSVSALVRTDGSIIGKGEATAGNRVFQIWKDSDLSDANPSILLRGDTTRLNLILPDIWYFHTITWDGTTANYYLDGHFETALNVGAAPDDPAQDIVFGARTNGTGYLLDGQIGRIFIYNRVLTPNEIQQLYVEPDILTRYKRLV